MTVEQLFANNFLHKYSCLFLNHSMMLISGWVIGSSGISLFFRLCVLHHVWLDFEVPGRKHNKLMCTQLLHTPQASSDNMFVTTAAAAALCMSLSFCPPPHNPSRSHRSQLGDSYHCCFFFLTRGLQSRTNVKVPSYRAKASGTV